MSDKKRFIKAVVTGTVCSLLTSVILMCVLAAVILSSGLLSSDVLGYVMTGITAASVLAGGFIAAKINGGAAIPAGLATAASFFIILTLSSLIKHPAQFTYMTLIKLVSELAAGVLGGILGLHEKKSYRI
jgi:putative membrane protein (TIGR04086 family)